VSDIKNLTKKPNPNTQNIINYKKKGGEKYE